MVGALRLGWAARAADAPSAALGPRLGVAGRGTRTLGTGTPGNFSPCTWRQRRCAHQLKQCLARFNGGGVTSASESDKSSACDESSSCDECEQSDVSVYSDNSACVGGWGIEDRSAGTGLDGQLPPCPVTADWSTDEVSSMVSVLSRLERRATWCRVKSSAPDPPMPLLRSTRARSVPAVRARARLHSARARASPSAALSRRTRQRAARWVRIPAQVTRTCPECAVPCQTREYHRQCSPRQR